MNDGGHTIERLRDLQALPLERKVGFTAARIIEWYNHYSGKVYVSFSGGKDSTVLLHIVRSLFPEVRAMFLDTGLEYPEIREFVRGFNNVDWIRPKMSFKQVIEKYGYPVIGKDVANKVLCVRNVLEKLKKTHATGRLSGLLNMACRLSAKKNGGGVCRRFMPRFQSGVGWEGGKRFNYAKWRFLLDAPFRISDQCCGVMKKSPANRYTKETGLMPIIATMAYESLLRQTQWLKDGCNAFDNKHPKSSPMSFWTEQDVLRYIKLHNLPIASVYGEIVEGASGKLYTTVAERTGCVFCLFGIKSDRKPNRIQRLALTHPKLWEYCVYKLGLKEVMEYIGEPYMPEADLFNYEKINEIVVKDE